jgi:hypothetical protein
VSERVSNTELMIKSFREMMKSVGTSIPGNIIAFDADTQLAQVQIGLESIDRNGDAFTPATLVECPVYMPGGADYFIETEINPNDEGLIIFAQKCIEEWVNSAGVAPTKILRFHDINDCMFLPGIRSQPGKIENFSNNGIKIRNKAGDKFFWFKNDGTAETTVTTFTINGNVVINGNTTQTGNTSQTGNITATGTIQGANVTGTAGVSAGGKQLAGHDHGPGSFAAGGDNVTGTSGANN